MHVHVYMCMFALVHMYTHIAYVHMSAAPPTPPCERRKGGAPGRSERAAHVGHRRVRQEEEEVDEGQGQKTAPDTMVL